MTIDRSERMRLSGMTGGYYWLPRPGDESVAWEVMSSLDLGFDADAGHVEMWGAMLVRLASVWGKDADVLNRTLRNCPFGLPRGRVTRPGKMFLVLHGGDSPCAEGLDRVLIAFGLDRHNFVRVVFDEHERTLIQEQTRVAQVLSEFF